MYDLEERASGTKQDFRPFWVQATAYDSATKYYTWTEQQFSPSTGGLISLEGGRFGDKTRNPVFDPNGVTATLPIFFLVALANFDPAVDWRYAVAGSGAGGGGSFVDGPSLIITYVTDVQCTGGTLVQSKTSRIVETSQTFTITITGNPTGGSFVLKINGTPITVQWNSTSDQLSALISPLFPNDPTLVTGGPFPGIAMQVYIKVGSTLTVSQNNLTGGTNPQVGIS